MKIDIRKQQETKCIQILYFFLRYYEGILWQMKFYLFLVFHLSDFDFSFQFGFLYWILLFLLWFLSHQQARWNKFQWLQLIDSSGMNQIYFLVKPALLHPPSISVATELAESSLIFSLVILWIVSVRCCKPSELTHTIELEKQKLNSFEKFIRLKTN